MRGRAGAAVRRRPVGRICPWPVSMRKIRNWNHSVIADPRSSARLTRNFGARHGARAAAAAPPHAVTDRTRDMHMVRDLRAFGFERSQSSKL